MTLTSFARFRPMLLGLAGVIVLPFILPLLGLTLNTATLIIALVIATLGLNMLMGYTGLVSFGHGAWFGIGAYGAALSQLHWFGSNVVASLLVGMLVVGAMAWPIGLLMLRRRGVYFALMTLALSALAFTIAFRWTAVTGGEDGLGGFDRGTLLMFDLDDGITYYCFVALIGLLVLYAQLRLVRSPFGHVLVAIRENQERATFQGYPVQRYKLLTFVLSAMVTGLAGGLVGFLNYIVSAEPTAVVFSGELLAMVVIGGMHNFLGPAVGVLFYTLFREWFSIWTENWLLWFGLIFVGFVMFSPGGLVGIWQQVTRRLRPEPEEAAAMAGRKIREGMDIPAFLQPKMSSETVLEASGLAKHFGGIRAVSNAGLSVEPGQIHALIGPNGAGKTTFFNLISGRFVPSSGSVRLHGREIQGKTPDAICQAGLARSFQITNLFEGINVRENIRLSVQAKHASRFNLWRDVEDIDQINSETDELMQFLGLAGMEQVKGADLSYGGQRLVDLGIALASKPQVLLLDEPLAGLAAAERERIGNLVAAISRHIPVLIVEHDIDRVLGFSQRVTVMTEGEVLMSGTPEEVRANKKVQEVYTGTGTPPVTGRLAGDASAQPMLLQVRNINTFYGKSHILNDASIDIRQGEIVALLGRNGAGKSTLLKSIAGLVPPRSGQITFDGQQIAGKPAADIARAGIGYVPQGRGLFAGMTVAENLSLGRLARATEAEKGTVWSEEKIFEMFPRLKERYRTYADYLSGGEQQMLAVARALSGNVRLLLLDEPFEGLSPAVVEELFTVFDQIRREVPIIIVEHNLDLVLALSDRAFALERGAVFHEGPARPLLEDLDYRKEILWL
ncbi:branched-chain amino acid ABC transporter ATP-binding protein/permease [Pseudohoeflea coraliihabitans]|uniref:ATP-binding cassette domain-containing protein n=1 Tax=Pseudohoeflea coraliihabitans TaxID=2860393 RepID=A0ABS6WMP4_9HYPH|nr:branched-chain amino acid ABC transporter ATP-binding protein/permease [Pseudohoeflea sp. DP4N28-3]MBW3097226.1 ATP-binding cassette domain-containing protein [Pseudohoeflea sp. DP4N28-3]